ncbi:divergent polysaccharide deacetylase family protein [Campylobacter peloridis]|nr:divergent polysaccharide deacetylase family protein [Campylobacter peloridis]
MKLKKIKKQYKVLLALCVIILGIILFAFSALSFKKTENKFYEINNSTIIEQNVSSLQQPSIHFEEVNSTLYDEKLEFLDKNISEILNLKTHELNTTKNDDNLSKNNINYIEKNQIDLSEKETNTSKEQNISSLKNNQQNKQNAKNILQTKPQLAIIIDDMASHTHVDMLKKTNLKLIPSFFPPDKRHPYTAEFAKDFDFFMVHLPLAAIKYDKAELNTLNPNDNKEKITKRIEFIKNEFPNLKFINNHTGSLFTSDEKAMERLFDALNKNGFIFVDSRTIGNSKAKKLSKKFHQPYIARDVFLDNEDNIEYIKKQIIQAINEAKKKGFAIAIGHPKEKTFEALVQSKDLLNSVELVYLNEIY